MKAFQVTHPMKMLDFIQKLYKCFKVLNKLSQKQSKDFQREIVTLLVDAKQNVDQPTYNLIIPEGAIQGFVLEMLGKIICRNPFKNQFELNKNLVSIADNLKKEQEELQKKQKVLERREEKIKGLEDNLITTLRQKLQSLQNQSMQRLIKRQGQIKKSISMLINQLKSKEKVILEKYEQTKSNQKTLATLQQKEKAISEKIKILERKQKELRAKGNQAQNYKKDSELLQCRENAQKLRESLKQATKRYKNLELAYKRLKNTKAQTENTPKITQRPQQNLKEQFDLQHLQLSQIQFDEKNNPCEQLINYIDFEQVNGKLESIKKIFNKSEPKSSITQIQQIKQLLEIKKSGEKAHVQVPSFSSQEEDTQQEQMPACLQKIEKQQQDHESFIQKIRNISLEEDKDKQQFITSNQISQWIDTCYKLNTPFQICQVLLQKILELIEESPYYLKIITYLSSIKVIDFLQHIYLSHQTNADIVETTTLIISRIKLKDLKLILSNSFLKALQIRMKIQSKNSFLFGNINYILSE